MSINKTQLEEAVAELQEGSKEYVELLRLLQNPNTRTNIPAILKEGTEAISEFRTDYAVARPAVENVSQALRAGVSTSEFQTSSAVTKVLTILGIGAPVLEVALLFVEGGAFFGGNSLWVTGASMVLKGLIAIAYTGGRSKIKAAAASVGG